MMNGARPQRGISGALHGAPQAQGTVNGMMQPTQYAQNAQFLQQLNGLKNDGGSSAC